MNESKQMLRLLRHVIKNEKRKYLLINGVIVRGIGLVALLSIFFGIIFGDIKNNSNQFLVLLVVKIILGAIIGYTAGTIEWKYYQNIIYKNYDKKASKKLALLDGIVGWGLLCWVIQIEMFTKNNPLNLPLLLFNLIIWSLGGLLFGLVMWSMTDIKKIRKLASEIQEKG